MMNITTDQDKLAWIMMRPTKKTPTLRSVSFKNFAYKIICGADGVQVAPGVSPNPNSGLSLDKICLTQGVLIDHHPRG